jgi:predicted negative regulator of RcsB-dependent stress response
MINLAIKKQEESVKITAIRRLTKTITTVVLVLYVVTASGLLGWWWWLERSRERSSLEIAELNAKLAEKVDEEAIARRLLARTKSVKTFVNNRRKIAPEIELQANLSVTVETMNYDSDKEIVNIAVSAPNPDEINKFVSVLSERYANVRLEKVGWEEESGWTGTVAYWGESE